MALKPRKPTQKRPEGALRPSGPFPVTKIESRILLDTPHTEMAVSQGAYVL